jgi:hypothetical protein
LRASDLECQFTTEGCTRGRSKAAVGAKPSFIGKKASELATGKE